MSLTLRRAVAVLLLTCAFAGSLAIVAGTASADERIVGGTKVSAADFAARYGAAVSVQARYRVPRSLGVNLPDRATHVCGGTLIAPTLVLTAAHCVSSTAPELSLDGYEVLTGTPTLARTRTTAGRVRVADVFVHPRYVPGANGNRFGWGFGFLSGLVPGSTNPDYDVAVLRLAAPVSGVQPVPLVAAGETAAWGGGQGRLTGAVALGWGQLQLFRTNVTKAGAAPLQQVALPIRSDRRCERSDGGLGRVATDFDAATMLCAGVAANPLTQRGARTACFGDSGGPLFAPAADGSLRVVGVTSWTSDALPCTGWTVYARVDALRDWITSVPATAPTGPGGLGRVTGVVSTPAGADALRISWSAPTGEARRYRVYREADVSSLGGFYGSTGRFDASTPIVVGVGATDAIERSIVVRGWKPRRLGANVRREVRIDAIDAEGNVVRGTADHVLAPVDSHRPSRAGRPAGKAGPRGRFVVRWRVSLDDDCIAAHVLQVRPVGGHWRDFARTGAQGICDRDALAAIGFGGGWYPPNSALRRPLQTVQVRGLAPGRYLARVVAIDRAGNRAIPSAIGALRITTLAKRPRLHRRSCFGFGFGVFCQSVASVGSTPVNVVIR